ncbi:MAG: Na/Pi cotransporter family protein, partial [Akkermansiaceae bacterium]|nr:Na/Pi cotransporter family protein [Akkermansiaceae bacterium]
TTVTAVGFVGAGLLTYEQSLGVIFGANIGTTLKGWIVAVFGLKVELGVLSLLLIFIAALFMLIGKGVWRESGKAVAGFALLFLGFDFLKEGLEGGANAISLEQFSSSTV